MKTSIITFLFVLFFFTFQKDISADSIELTAEDYRLKANEAQQKAQYLEALKYYTKAEDLGLKDAVMYNDLAILYEQMGIPHKAEQYYIQAIQLDASYLPSYSNLGYFYKSFGEDKKAIKFFLIRYELAEEKDTWSEKAKEEILRIDPRYKQKFLEREAKKLDAELEEAAHFKFSERIKKANELFQRAKDLQAQAHYDKAIYLYDQALKVTPDNPKIIRAKQEAISEKRAKDIDLIKQEALEMLAEGDYLSARKKIQKILATNQNNSE